MMLSVLMITYNHEKFIAQALDSVLMQKVDFGYEIVIGDDCSTDHTWEILCDYRERYPDRIRLLLPAKNQGAVKNLLAVLEACRGRYVALLEGDDFWTCPDKLQEQVRFLETHSGFVMCFTNSTIVDENGVTIKEDRLDSDRRKHLSQVEILSGLVPPANTTVFRNSVVKIIPWRNCSCVNGDLLLFSTLTEFGVAAYIDKHTASYRMHNGGVWSAMSEEYIKINLVKTWTELLNIFSKKHKDIILLLLRQYYMSLMEYYKLNDRIIKYMVTFMRYSFNDMRYMEYNFIYNIRCFVFTVIMLLKNKLTRLMPETSK